MESNRPKVIAFSGMDGAGKSRHARALVEDLRRRGRRALYRRLRFPFVTSVPVLLYSRLRGHSYEIREGKQKLRAHAFGAAQLVRILYPLTLFMDLLLITWILVRLPTALGRTVVCDRFVLDSLIDVASSCELEIAPDSRLARLYETLVPTDTTTFLLAAPREVLLSRRAESSIDPSFDHRSQLYEQATENENVHVVTSDGEFETVREGILAILTEEWPDAEASGPQHALSRRWYAGLRDGNLPRAARTVLLLLTHWLFQSAGAMGRTERILKVGLSLGTFALVLPILVGPLGWGFGVLLAVLLAHSANFILNAQLPVVLKHGGRVMDQSSIHQYADYLTLRIRDRGYLEGAVVVGSLARNELGSSSDLDVRIIPRPGLLNAFRAAAFIMRERAWALWRVFPLDIYLAENPVGLAALQSEKPRLLCDNRGALVAAFPSTVRT